MAKFRKKPVVIEAIQWHGFKVGPHDLGITPHCSPSGTMGWIGTLEGGHVVTPEDWIITGIKGEKYPCKPDIFEATYEDAFLNHKQTHIFLHKCFDELLTDMIRHTDMLPSTTTVKEFIDWSHQQTISPTEVKEDG